jgi:hypothetical protein
MEYLKTYLDDLLILTHKTFNEHPLKLKIFLSRFSTSGMRIHDTKPKIFAERIEYMGY